MSKGVDALSQGHKNPINDLAHLPAHTQCSYFKVDSALGDDYVASIAGQVSGQRVTLTIEINADDPAYTAPGTPLRPGDINHGGGTNLQLPGDRSPRYSVIGPKGQEPAVIVLIRDRRSGTIDAWYADPGDSQETSRASSTSLVPGAVANDRWAYLYIGDQWSRY
jgi:hypothetical protein